MIKAIFHIHTEYSDHGNLKILDLGKFCFENKINVIFITDHNTIQGAKVAQKLLTGVKVIIGEEIRTTEGEVIGIFLKDEIRAGLTPEETISLIRAQGGAVVVPHPCDRLRFETIQSQALSRILSEVDIIETFNSRNLFSIDDKKANDLANKYHKCKIVGSDAHTYKELKNAAIFLENFTSREEFVDCLGKARFVGRKAGLWPHVVSKVIKILNSMPPTCQQSI